MKKATIILILILAVLCVLFVSCENNGVNTDTSSDTLIDTSSDSTVDTDDNVKIDYEALLNELSKDLDSVKSMLEKESTDTTTDLSVKILDELKNISAECIFDNEDIGRSLILKNGMLVMTSEEMQIVMKLCGNSMAIITTANNKTSCSTIAIPQSESNIEGEFILTKEHIAPTNNPGEYKLSKSYLRELSKFLVFLTENSDLECIKNATVFVDFSNYSENKEVNFDIECNGKEYSATLGLSGLIDGNSFAALLVKEGESSIIDISALFENNEVISINLNTKLDNDETKIVYNSSQIELFVKEDGKAVIELSLEKTESEINDLSNYDLKLKCEIDDSESGQIDIKASFKCKSFKNDVTEYLLEITTLEDGEAKTSVCTLITPTDKEINLSEYEQKLLDRIDNYQSNKESIDAQMSDFAKIGADYLKEQYSNIRFDRIPTVYYKYDDINDVIYLAQYQAGNIYGEIFNSSQVIIDYENYTYYYNEVTDSFADYKFSQQEIDILMLIEGLDAFYEKYDVINEENASNPYVYKYVASENMYLCVAYIRNNYSIYMLTPADFYEFSLMNYCCPIYYVNDVPLIHIPITSTYDEKCKEIFLCGECGCSFISKNSIHEAVTEILKEESEDSPLVTVDRCVRCDYRIMNIGNEYFINLEYSEYYEGHVITGIEIPNPKEDMVLEISSMKDASIISLKRFGYNDSKSFNFKKISFPNEMKYIEYGSIRGIKIEELILPNHLYKIEGNGIESCSIKELVIPEKVSYLEDYFIHYCSGLKKITINSKSLVKFGRLEQSFEELIFNGQCNDFYCPKGIKSLTLPIGTLTIDGIKYASNLRKITIPEGTKQIKEGMFKECKGLAEVIIPSTVTFIGDYAFEGCTNLKTITIPSTVKKICEYAFGLSGIIQIDYDGTAAEWSNYQNIFLTNISVNYLKEEEQA